MEYAVSDGSEFRLFQMLHGGGTLDRLVVGRIPTTVSRKLGWSARTVYLTRRDAQKIRFHPMHGMNATKGLHLPLVIANGDYYQTHNRGSELQIEAVLHEPDQPRRAYFLVLARDRGDTGLFLRTFYFTAKLSRNKMRHATTLLDASGTEFFKRGPRKM